MTSFFTSMAWGEFGQSKLTTKRNVDSEMSYRKTDVDPNLLPKFVFLVMCLLKSCQMGAGHKFGHYTEYLGCKIDGHTVYP